MWHDKSVDEVIAEVGTSVERGLSLEEVRLRHKKFGRNVLKAHKRKSKFSIFLGQFNSLLIWVLLVAAGLSFAIGHSIDAIVILIIVLINSVVGFVQEYKAEEVIEKLKQSLKYSVLVLRDGKRLKVNAEDLVPGDVAVLNAGDRVLADCRVVEADGVEVNEAILSGESFPIGKDVGVLKKDVVLAERKNMFYAGTTLVRGRALAVVVETGQSTEFGKLAELVQKTEDEIMPLEKKLNVFSRNISIFVLVLVGIVFGIGLLEGQEFIEMFLVAVSLAVGAIPEGLPAIIAITLAVAVRHMYKVNVLIRKLPAAETLGRTTVICTDKTGTLTQEELSVDEIWTVSKKDVERDMLLKIGVLCNDARDEDGVFYGDPTEIALIKEAKEFGLIKKDLTEANPKVREFVFDSNRKMMSVIRQDGKIRSSYVKGAPLNILERCTKEFVNGKFVLMDSKRKIELEKISRGLEKKGLRVLGFGFKQVRGVDQKEAENNLIFVGFVGMIDPPRGEVKEAVREALEAGVKIKIITGDSAYTTQAIAKKLGIVGEMIEGKELDKLKEKEWTDVVRTKTIFARITPEQKLKIVDLLKSDNEIVAVTGDGVNDILALKRADIGVAMGKRGSDVARDSSDMVLLDDNFASIINAIRQGRRVFDNMKKSIKFLLAANFGEVFIVLIGLLFGLPLIFLPLAILWMNLVTDSLPALALAVEPAEENVMKRGPKGDGILHGIWGTIIWAGVLMVVSSFISFNYGMNFGLDVARTMAISTAIFFELGFAFSCKSKRSLFKTGILDNKYLIWAVLISGGLHILAIYSGLGELFGFVFLSGREFWISFGLGMSGLVCFEAWKVVGNRR